MKKLLLYPLFFAAFVLQMQAQQTPLTSFPQYSWQLINPAAIDGMQMLDQKKTLINFAGRLQWLGVNQGPRFMAFSLEHMPNVKNSINNSAPNVKFGLHAFVDKTDQISNSGLNLNFSYYFKTGERSFWHIGINGGLARYIVNIDNLKFEEAEAFDNSATNRLHSDFSVGIFYRSVRSYDKRGIYAGISMPQTFVFDLNNQDSELSATKRRVQHLYFMMGGYLPNYERTIFVQPNLLVRYVPSYTYQTLTENIPVSADIGARVNFAFSSYNKDFGWVGVGYGTNGNAKLEVGAKQNLGRLQKDLEGELRFGISWEIPVHTNRLNLGQSIEINVAYAFD